MFHSFTQCVQNTPWLVIDSVHNISLLVFFHTLIIANRYNNWSCLVELT